MVFNYSMNVGIRFGNGSSEQLGNICREYGLSNGLLVSDPFFVGSGLAQEVIDKSEGALVCVFSDLQPNPTVESVNACVELLEKNDLKFIVALGGGSSLDCAKAASVAAHTGRKVQDFHSGGVRIAGSNIPVIAMPTTAGTGSEVTNVAVLSDAEKGIKGPMASDHMYAKLAIIDPLFTVSVPKSVTASTGLDTLSHALEGYWSVNHQPICDAYAIYAAKKVFENLEHTCSHLDDVRAREEMSLASLIAGLAFAVPKTAAAHACSFPLTNIYHIPHGEACAFTLDSLVLINCETERARLDALARMVGFASPEAMAAEIARLKEITGMRRTLAQAGIREEDVPELAARCKHPNLLNNPTEMTQERLIKMFMNLR